jgi:hypothetical protein
VAAIWGLLLGRVFFVFFHPGSMDVSLQGPALPELIPPLSLHLACREIQWNKINSAEGELGCQQQFASKDVCSMTASR